MQLGYPGMPNLAAEQSDWDYANDTSPFAQAGVSEFTHQAHSTASVDKLNVVLGQPGAQRPGSFSVTTLGRCRRSAEDADGSKGDHIGKLTDKSGVAEAADSAVMAQMVPGISLSREEPCVPALAPGRMFPVRALFAFGALFLIVGVIWLGQGVGLIGGSFMTGETVWAVIGAASILIGGFLIRTGFHWRNSDPGDDE